MKYEESQSNIKDEYFAKINEVFKIEYGNLKNLSEQNFEKISDDIANAIKGLFI